jgi:HK97 family phage prohead protease
MERRAIADLSINDKKIIGRPVVYNSLSENLGGFVEIISAGAFSDSLGGDIRALVEHDTKLILGRTKSKTLSIKEDERGLLVEISPPNIQSARDLMVSIERGDIAGMSFGFSVPAGGDKWDYSVNPTVRTITKAVLHEVTITSLPAYSATDVQIAMRTLNLGLSATNHNHYISLLELS